MFTNTRKDILEILGAGPMTLTAICNAINSYGHVVHEDLKALAADGFVKASRVGQSAYGTAQYRARIVWRLSEQPPPNADILIKPTPEVSPPESDEARPRGKREPHKVEAREPMEVLAVLAGRGNFNKPTEGRATDGSRLTPFDIAHAVAAAQNKLGASMAMAIACQKPSEWQRVHAMAYVPLLRDLQRQRAAPGIVAGPLKYRARIVLYDAFTDLIWPKRRLSNRKAARAAKIHEAAYEFLHKYTTGFLQSHANAAAGEAVYYLFAPESHTAGDHALVMTDTDGRIDILHAISALELMIKADEYARQRGESENNVAILISEIREARGRSGSVGVLCLRGIEHTAVYVNPNESEETKI